MARDTIVDRFVGLTRERAAKPALWYKTGQTWKHLTWEEYGVRVRNFAGGLLDAGFEPGSCIAIMSHNCPEWLIADVGTMMARGAPVGIYYTCTSEQAAYIANHCEARVLVLQDRSFWEIIEPVVDELEHTDRIVMIRDAEEVDHEMVVSFDAFLARGAEHRADVDARFAELEGDDLATLIYTSGTTGPPKGVMLSHDNISYTSKTALDVAGDIAGDDVIVSYLPLSHVAEQIFSIYVPVSAGCEVWFAEDIKTVRDALAVARPTVFLAVPRVWEKFRNALDARLAEATGFKKKIVDFSRKTLLEAGKIIVEHGEEGLSPVMKMKYRLADRLFANKLKAGIGFDRLKVAVSGAAPIGDDVLEFFLSCGIIIHEVYGQSEDCGPTTYNYPQPGKRKLGTVGIPFPGVDVEIAEDGEILVRGPNVFMGYYKNPEATDEALVDGWLHSGDVGVFDDDGFLRITDRKKDLIITAGGKNVAPQNIESELRSIRGVGQAVVIGDRRKFLSALLTIDVEQGPELAEDRGWPTDPHELVEHEAFRDWVDEQVDRVNADAARYERIRKYELLPEDFTVEAGELTPTQKVKRRVVEDRYDDVIESFYEGLD